MMQDDALHALAGAILDGAVVDWASAESNAADASQRRIVSDLKLIAAIAELHGSSGLQAVSVTGMWPPPDPGSVETWGTLHLLEKVGQGAYGEVYRAWDTRLNREVALKLLRPGLADGEARSTAVIQEGRLLARLRHPNIATVYGAEWIEDRAGLWMEFIRGRTLAQALEERGAFSAAETIRVGLEICRAVTAVHGAGLVHRDIKAQNVMLADDGRVVLMDFGSGSRLLDDSGNRLAGTPLYLPPELLCGGEPSVRSDIYSIGVLLYHLLTRSYPLQGADIDDLRLAHRRADRIDLRTARRDVPRKLAHVVQRAIEPEPDRRYTSVDAMARDLSALEPRPQFAAVASVLGAAMVLLLIAAIGLEWRSRQTGGSGPTDLVVSGLSRFLSVRGSPIRQPVIVVLPFENLSTEPDSDVLVEGLTVDILHNLAQIEGLQVRARDSSFAFGNKPADLNEVGRTLDANLFLLGLVRRSGTQLRIDARLMTSDRTILWSHQFDRELSDVFAVQDEIALAIVNRLRLRLGRGQRRYDADPLASELYLKARALLGRGGGPDLLKAAALFEQVLVRDRRHAPAHAGLANAYALASAPLSSTLSFEKAQEIIRSAAFQAYDLDPRLAETQIALGWMYARENHWSAADKAFLEAIRLNRGLTEAYTGYTNAVLQPLGQLDEALRILREAERNDQRSLALRREIGIVQLHKGEYAAAIDTFERLRAVDPDFPFVRTHLGRALTFAGSLPSALAMLEALDGSHLGPFRPEQAKRPPWLALAYVRAGRRADAEALVTAQGGAPSGLAVVYAALGDRDQAFEALERLSRTQPHHMGRMLIMPELAGLRDDARYTALRARFNLPPR